MKHSLQPAPRSFLPSSLLGAILLSLSAGLGFAAEKQPARAITILGNHVERRATLLAIDDMSLPFRKNLALHLGKPKVRPEPVLKPSPRGSGAPDDLAAHFYGTVLHDGGKFRMWYYACH